MNVLLVAATRAEIAGLMQEMNWSEGPNHWGQNRVEVLITGVGMVATAFSMAKALARTSFDIALNLGIAGCFDRSIALGTLLQITSDRFSELGAEDGEGFIPIDDLGFGTSLTSPLSPGLPTLGLAQVSAITVNTVHGNECSIQRVTQRYGPIAESMEGAAFFYACHQQALASWQVRAISNYVETRNKAAWDIPLAVKNLNIFGLNFLRSL